LAKGLLVQLQFDFPDLTQVYLKPFTDLVEPIFEHFGTMGAAKDAVAP
jgi:hypothetical protein